MAQIQTPGEVAALMAQFKIRSPFGLLLLEDIQPVVIVADVSGGSVARAGFPKEAIGVVQVTAGGAGAESEVVMTGVGGQGVVQVINRAFLHAPSSGFINIRQGTATAITNITDVTNKQYTDLRSFGAGQVPTLLIGRKTNANPEGSFVGNIAVDGVVATMVELNYIMGPGDQLVFANAQSDEDMGATIFWTEHLLEDR